MTGDIRDKTSPLVTQNRSPRGLLVPGSKLSSGSSVIGAFFDQATTQVGSVGGIFNLPTVSSIRFDVVGLNYFRASLESKLCGKLRCCMWNRSDFAKSSGKNIIQPEGSQHMHA